MSVDSPRMALSVEQIAERTGSTIGEIGRLLNLGLIETDESAGFAETLIPRVRLVLHLEESGISLEDVATAVHNRRLSLSFADRLFGRPVSILDRTVGETLGELGITAEFFSEIQVALGLEGESALVREDDAEVLSLLDQQLQLGLDEKVLSRFFQVTVDNLRRVAQGGREMWITGVEEPLLAQGLTHAELLEAEAGPAPQSQLQAERIVQLLWNRFIEEVIFQAAVQHLETALDEAGVSRRSDPQPPAVAFVDLTGYTSLTERVGDEAAADHSRALVDVLRPISAKLGGRLVKMLGDGAMFHFRDPTAAVRCGLDLVDAIPAAGLPLARYAVNAGPLILRDADFFGRTVNIAARLVDYARPREVLVSEAVVELADNWELLFTEIGPVSLKGVPNPVMVFNASRK